MNTSSIRLCASSDGKWVGAASGTQSFISSDSGATWQTNNLAGGRIACSANGSTWLIAGAQIYTSTNSGVSWQTNLPAAQWDDGAVSADGSLMVAMSGGQGFRKGRVIPTPQLNIQQKDSSLAVSWLIPSTNFVLQQSADITALNWTPVTNNPTLNFTNLQQEVSVPTTSSNRFFRLIAQ